jgi:hypothetical protein
MVAFVIELAGTHQHNDIVATAAGVLPCLTDDAVADDLGFRLIALAGAHWNVIVRYAAMNAGIAEVRHALSPPSIWESGGEGRGAQ